jgi:hypothetical protein
MPEKRETPEGADDAVPQDPRDKAKAALPEPQSPAVETHTRCYSAYEQRYQGPPVRVSRADTSAWQGDG